MTWLVRKKGNSLLLKSGVTWLFTLAEGKCFELSQVNQGNFSRGQNDQVEKNGYRNCQFHFLLCEALGQ